MTLSASSPLADVSTAAYSFPVASTCASSASCSRSSATPGPNGPLTASPRRTRTSRMLGNCLIWSMNTSRCWIVPVTIIPVSPASTMSCALCAKSCACSIAVSSLTCAVHRIMAAHDAMVIALIETIRRTQIFWLANLASMFMVAMVLRPFPFLCVQARPFRKPCPVRRCI
ncbi:MAG: hypothetical protein AW07_03551 [Candidatus Accumulibacter sp. SK-11]|nr:MAG: hypothetical protein AW07_03551 [Candidatus Accumulibacter sp. SK-11]